MKIDVILTKDEFNCDRHFELHVNSEFKFGIGNGLCPEDALLGRDLDFVYLIPKLMELAYESGKRNEQFEIIKSEYKD